MGCGSSSQSIVLVEGVLLFMVKTPLYQDHTRYGWKKEVRGCGSLCCGPIIIGGKKDGKSPNSPHLMYQECKQGLSTEGALMLRTRRHFDSLTGLTVRNCAEVKSNKIAEELDCGRVGCGIHSLHLYRFSQNRSESSLSLCLVNFI